jgi:putative inorganic carbon (HCO3(-)) transporter
VASSNKNQRAARRQAARKQADREEAAAKKAGRRNPPAAAAPAKRPPDKRMPDASSPAAEPMSTARRVAWWSVLAMVFLVPVAISNLSAFGIATPLTYDSFDIVKMSLERILGFVALGAWAWDLLRRGGKVRHTPVDWLILALLAWVALSTVTSIHPPTALFGKPRRYEGLLSFINYALIYFLVLQFADSTARVLKLAQALFWSSVVVAAYGLLQYAGHDPFNWGALPFEVNRAFSTYGNPDLLGAFLIFTVTVALALALFERRLGWRIVYWVGFGLNGVTLIVAFTRGAWIGGAVALVVLGVVAWRQRAHLARIDLVPAVVFVAAGVAVAVRSLSSANEVMNFGKRLASIFQFGTGSGQTRTEIWQAAGAAIKERPLLGWGADTFRLVFPKFKPVEYVRDAGGLSVADNAHDYPLQLATGIGVPGMLMFYGIVVWAGVRSFSTVFRRDDDPGRLLIGAFWAAALGYLVQLLFGVSVTGVTFLLWIAFAVALAPTAKLVEVRALRWGVVAGAAVLAVCVVGIGYQGVVLAADRAYMQSQASPSAEQRISDVQRALRLFPYSQTYRWGLGVAYMDQLKLLLQQGSQAQQAGQDTTAYYDAAKQAFINAETAFKDAIAFVPDEYDNYVSLAELYIIAGQVFDKSYYQQALDVVQQGLKVEPHGTAIRVQQARALWGQGKKAEAEKILRYCLQIDPMGGQAALQLATYLYDQGKTAEALQILRDIEARAPGQAGVAEAISKLEAAPQQ